MNTAGKILVAGIIGTTFMTMFSYLIADKEEEQYREPELLNALIDRSKYLPSISNKKSHPLGWGAHFLIGILFMISYRMLWHKALKDPSTAKTIIIGAASGAVGIISWKIFFSQHDNPPHNDRYGYYRQLFFAHIIFSAGAIVSYKQLSSTNPTSNKDFKNLITRIKVEREIQI